MSAVLFRSDARGCGCCIPLLRPTCALLIALLACAAQAGTVVGRIGGSFGVTPTGTAAYTMPIQVAAGMGGLRPDVALVYGSHGGDGPAGPGWALTGFPRIARCPRTLAVDGAVQGVRFTNQDRFCLEGQPLVLIKGTWGAAGAEYRSEVHGYERIFSWGRQGSGPAWFELRRPDGLVERYGNDDDSRVEVPGGSEVVAWALNEIEDRFQQRVGFAYVEDNARGEHYPAEVRWTYGASQGPEAARLRLALRWAKRPVDEVRDGYLWGVPWQVSVRLEAIDYEADRGAGLELVHRYALAYTGASAGGTSRSRLASITQCGPRDCLPPTTFDWYLRSTERTSFPAAGPTTAGALVGDFNGDGAADLFGLLGGTWTVWPADPQSGGFQPPITLPFGGSGNYKVGLPFDYNGDGLTDLLVAASDGTAGLVYLSPSTPGGAFVTKGLVGLSPAVMEMQPMDIDGDHLDDLVYLYAGAAYVRRNTGGSLASELGGGLRSVAAPYTAFTAGNGFIEPADFDGDGRADLLVTRSKETTTGRYRWEAFLSTGTRFATDPIGSFTTDAAPRRALVADLNGDGLSDVLRYDDGAWHSYISRGSSLVAQDCPSPPTAAGTYPAVLDHDNDGRSDLLLDFAGHWHVYTAHGGCLSGSRYTDVDGPQPAGSTVVLPADINGDGNADISFGGTAFDPREWLTSLYQGDGDSADGSHHPRPDLLHEIHDGLGNRTTISYHALSGWSSYTANGTTPAKTRLLRGGPIVVVSYYATSTGTGNEPAGMAFRYGNALVDLQGRGFLGFATVRTTDTSTGLATETAYSQVFPYAGRTEQVTVFDGGTRVSVSDPSWSDAVTAVTEAARDVHFVHLTAETREDYETDPDGGYAGALVRRTSRTLGWNLNHGAVASEQVSVTAPQEGNVAHHMTRSVTFDEGPRSAAGCLGLPLRVDTTRDVDGSLAETRTLQQSWQASTCRLAAQVEGPVASPSQQLRTSHGYDLIGRVTSTVLQDAAGQLPARQTRFEYAADGGQPTVEAAVIGGEADLVSRHEWHEALGLVAARTSPQGQSNRWAYDDFGRLLEETRSPGRTQYSYTACGPCFAPNARYAVRQTRSDGLWSESQHDSLGRIVGRSSILADGRVSRQLLEYDAAGRLARESRPFLDGATQVYWTTYGYDHVGRIRTIDRPVSEDLPSGATETFLYAGLATTSRDAEARVTVRGSDALGRVVSVRGPMQELTTYAYTAFGDLRTVTDPAGHQRELLYDPRGRLVESIDPDAGRRRFGYDAFGALVSRTDGDAATPTVSWQYDQLGRPTARTDAEGTTAWTYSATPGPSRGLVTLATAPSGVREAFAYDGSARLQSTTTTIDGIAYQTDYVYDTENKLRSMTYPATVGWRPRFFFGYTAGHLTAVIQQDLDYVPVFWLHAADAAGRVTEATLGAGAITEEARYDAATGQLDSIRSGPVEAPGTLQDYAYSWDRTGNLMAREDRRASPRRVETFTYDAANRVTSAALDGVPTFSASYAPDGNLLSRSDIGAYSYDGTQPHAVTRVSSGPAGTQTFWYDARGNMIYRPGVSLSWNSGGQPLVIGNARVSSRFAYGPSGNRARQEARTGSVTRITHYVGPHFEVEIEGSTRRYRSTVFAYGRAVLSQVESSTGGIEAYHVLHDHQGSVDRLARAAGGGSDVLALAFDAWGRRRNTNWTPDPVGSRYGDRHWTERGYTGHEHLDSARLIHMNGRLQDPHLGRMLSPDPVLGSLGQPQTLNPYSYVANNPTSYVDPSGYFLGRVGDFFQRGIRHLGSAGRRVIRRWGRQIVAAVAAYYTAGAVSSWAYAAQAPGLTAATVGTAQATSYVVGGMAGGAIAGAISTGELRGAIVGAVSGAAMGGIVAHWGGSYSIGRVAAEATVGGVSAELNGGDFSQGFLMSGSLSSLTWGAVAMRESMIEQSLVNPRNAAGVSHGYRGDGFKLGGSRWPSSGGLLGGFQGGDGYFFGIRYEPGSFLDRLIETYAGPHDFLNRPVFYDQVGNNAGRWIGLEAISAANVIVATPFAAASVVPTFAYPAFAD